MLTSSAIAQNGTNTNGSSKNSIPTAVPFLTISPDSRSGALGDAGVALSPDVNANYWNPSKLAFLNNGDAFSLSYIPWLRSLVPDISLSYLSYAHKFDGRNAIGASIRYFNLGSIELVDASANNQGTYTPSEYSVDVSFARNFGEEFSLGLTARYIHSDLSNASFANESAQLPTAGSAIAADVSLYYRKPPDQSGKTAGFAFGANISNIGPKISYAGNGPQYFLPTNLKIGAANTWEINDYSEVTLTLDMNKLLVPTPPITDANGNIIKGKDDDISLPASIFQSFTDAPGGTTEELQEITYSAGIEYQYDKAFALRTGYFYENPNQGSSQYFTFGFGLKYSCYNFDFSYLAANRQNSPMANTIRFTLLAGF